MKAKIRALVTLAALCVALAVIYILLPSRSARTNSAGTLEAENTPLMITDIPVNELSAMALSNEHATFGIINRPEGISAVPGSGIPFSAEEMRGIVYLACHLSALRILDDMPLPAETDLEKAPARFSLILIDGSEYNFVILGKSPVSEDYLLYSESQETTFLIRADDARWFLQGAET